MTDTQRAAIRAAISRQTEADTQTRDTARAALVRDGIYTPSGQLTREYGGGADSVPTCQAADDWS